MKCKKADCNGVIKEGVCIECGAKSSAGADAPVKSDEKSDKQDTGREPEAASSKVPEPAETRSTVDEKPKPKPDKKEETPDKDKSSEKAAAKKESEAPVKTEKSKAPPAASSESKQLEKPVAQQSQTVSKNSSVPAPSTQVKKSQPSDARVANKQSEAADVPDVKVHASKPVEDRSGGGAKKEAPGTKKEGPGLKPEAPKDVVETAGSQEKSTDSVAAAQPQKKQAGKQETGSQKSKNDHAGADKVAVAPPEQPQALQSLPVLGKRNLHSSESDSDSESTSNPDIEPTIPLRTVHPDEIEQTLNLRTVNLEDTAAYRNIIHTVKSMLEPREVAPSREDLLLASRALRHVMPYNFDAWRLHADLLLTAIHQLETRQLMPDPNFTLMAIPLREDDLRDAAEQALRECAHFADNQTLKIKLIDEANQIRRLTWF